MIALKQVSKRFVRPDGSVFTALSPSDLEIQAGEIFGLIGPSGAGKSTLLRLINLLERPDGGQVVVDGQTLTALPAAPKLAWLFAFTVLRNTRVRAPGTGRLGMLKTRMPPVLPVVVLP